MQTTRRAVLIALKTRGWATVNDLADEVGIKAISVRHHLNALLADGMVQMEERRQSVGRPLHVFTLSELGERVFWQVVCPYYGVRPRRSELCQVGEILLRALVGATSEAPPCQVAGDSRCTYFLPNG